MSGIRENPPESVTCVAELNMYRTLYDDITDNGVLLQYQDRHLLGELAVTQVEMNRLRAELVANGEWLEVQGDRNMVRKKNPCRDALEKLRPVALRIMKEFKMSPMSRGNKAGAGLHVENPKNDDDGWGDV